VRVGLAHRPRSGEGETEKYLFAECTTVIVWHAGCRAIGFHDGWKSNCGGGGRRTTWCAHAGISRGPEIVEALGRLRVCAPDQGSEGALAPACQSTEQRESRTLGLASSRVNQLQTLARAGCLLVGIGRSPFAVALAAVVQADGFNDRSEVAARQMRTRKTVVCPGCAAHMVGNRATGEDRRRSRPAHAAQASRFVIAA